MTDKLTISGDIESRWTRLIFELGGNSYTIMTSYVFDGLENILTAVSNLQDGLDGSEVSLIDEPYEHILQLTKADTDNLIIAIYTFDHWTGKLLRDRRSYLTKPTFTIETTIKRFALQVFNLFDFFKTEYGLNGYKERWGHEFPQSLLDKIRHGK